jgi:hypothetical protein
MSYVSYDILRSYTDAINHTRTLPTSGGRQEEGAGEGGEGGAKGGGEGGGKEGGQGGGKGGEGEGGKGGGEDGETWVGGVRIESEDAWLLRQTADTCGDTCSKP